jgi:4'-phosphopantetheinyl transferase
MLTENIWKVHSFRNNLVLEEMEMHIWRVRLARETCDLEYYWSIISDDERNNAKEFRFIKDKNRYIIARAILRKIISLYMNNVDPKSIIFGYTEYAKPYLITNNNIYLLKFNLSHSEDSIIYGFSREVDIGVDIEFFNQELIIEDVIEYCCSIEEKKKLEELSIDHKYFYKLWVSKESLVKAMGLGLSYDFRKISINIDNDVVNIISPNKSNWMIKLFPSYDGYYSAVASEKPMKKIIFLNYSNDS